MIIIKPTKYQELIITELLFIDSYIEITKNKKGEYTHKVVHVGGRKEIIRSDTSKAIQRFLNSKIKILKHGLDKRR